MRAQMQARRAEMQVQVEAVMTPEQTTRFRAYTAEQQAERRGRRGQPRD